jgi:hypothetical protein
MVMVRTPLLVGIDQIRRVDESHTGQRESRGDRRSSAPAFE